MINDILESKSKYQAQFVRYDVGERCASLATLNRLTWSKVFMTWGY